MRPLHRSIHIHMHVCTLVHTCYTFGQYYMLPSVYPSINAYVRKTLHPMHTWCYTCGQSYMPLSVSKYSCVRNSNAYMVLHLRVILYSTVCIQISMHSYNIPCIQCIHDATPAANRTCRRLYIQMSMHAYNRPCIHAYMCARVYQLQVLHQYDKSEAQFRRLLVEDSGPDGSASYVDNLMAIHKSVQKML